MLRGKAHAPIEGNSQLSNMLMPKLLEEYNPLPQSHDWFSVDIKRVFSEQSGDSKPLIKILLSNEKPSLNCMFKQWIIIVLPSYPTACSEWAQWLMIRSLESNSNDTWKIRRLRMQSQGPSRLESTIVFLIIQYLWERCVYNIVCGIQNMSRHCNFLVRLNPLLVVSWA